MNFRQQLYRLYTELVTPQQRDVFFMPPTAPLNQLNVALVTTAGTRLPHQKPFDTDRGDPSFREIPADTPTADLVADHTHYDTGPASSDPDCVFPLQTVRLLANEGVIGGVAPVHFGFMGYTPDLTPLMETSIPQVVQRLKETGVGAVLLSPG
jgi:D-proline reductase (dithiol) PrdB